LLSSAKLFVPKEKMSRVGTATRWVEDFSPGALKSHRSPRAPERGGPDPARRARHRAGSGTAGGFGSRVAVYWRVIVRIHRGERATIVFNLFYLAMSAFVAWRRFGPESFIG
jgi:hypothetical protein